MRLLGFEITRQKAAVPATTIPTGWNWLSDSRGWWPVVREPFTGAWQRNMEQRHETVLAHHAVYACIDRIASDVATCRLKLVMLGDDGVWIEVTSQSPFLQVLQKPNGYQTRIQFFEDWVRSKLIFGNAYVLKEREDTRGLVRRLYVLDPCKVKPLVAPDGSIYYQLGRDNLSGLDTELVTVPASEIIHDMTTVRLHPLCGLPPMAPAALAASHGINIQRYSARFFANGASPSGMLTAPGEITQATADRLKAYFEEKFTGANVGAVAVLGDGLKYEQMSSTAVNAQLIEQLGLSAKMVCSAFNVPPYKVQAADPPAYNNIGALNQGYYSDCLRKYFEAIEALLDDGLELTTVPGKIYGTEFDTNDLLRMDPAAQAESIVKLTGAGLLKLNEGRNRLGYPDMEGGDNAFMQQQNWTVPALAEGNVAQTNAQPAADGAAPGDATTTAEDSAATAQLAAWELKRQLDLLAA